MNLVLAMVIAVFAVWLLGHVIALASLIMDQQFMNDYAREFWRIEARCRDRRLLLDRIYGQSKRTPFLFTRRADM